MNENDFLDAIQAAPTDPVPRLVYADWLDEQGDPRGELLRIQEELRRIEVSDRPLKEARMHELLNDDVEPLLIRHTTSTGMEEVLIFPGEFLMGSPPNEAGHGEDENQVAVQLTQPFWLARCVVTREDYGGTMKDRPLRPNRSVPDDSGCPATYVDWEDAVAFCRNLTEQELQAGQLPEGWEYALPTEAQWEYACRGGTTTPYSCGADRGELFHHAWFDETTSVLGQDSLQPVGRKRPNPWGLFDMHGNVLEWCRDFYTDRLPGGQDPEIATGKAFRSVRGGFWRLTARDCRSAYRGKYNPGQSAHFLGFRVARIPTNR